MHATSAYIADAQFIRHQTVERMQARSEDFHARVVRALLHTRVFLKFKSSCTVHCKFLYRLITSSHKIKIFFKVLSSYYVYKYVLAEC